MIPIARMDREAGNGTIPPERDTNAVLCALAPDLLKALRAMERYVLPDKLPSRDLREAAVRACAVARELIEQIDSREYKPTPGPWVVVTGQVFAKVG